MFGQQQQLKEEYPTPEAKKLFGKLLYHSTEVFSRTYLPLVLVNRPLVVQHLKDAKLTIDKLLQVV